MDGLAQVRVLSQCWRGRGLETGRKWAAHTLLHALGKVKGISSYQKGRLPSSQPAYQRSSVPAERVGNWKWIRVGSREETAVPERVQLGKGHPAEEQW